VKGIWITRLADGQPGRRLAVKDLFDTEGIRTTYGSAVFADHVPDRTAAAVLALEGSGWTNVGKSNLHEFAWGITSQNPHYGDVPNPRFPGRTAGGSSGGSAAAIVVGEADLGLGTDSGGSIRIPAACCELTGFKPSFGLVPMGGCFPLAASFDHAGPLAPDVAGCAEAMRALAGVEPESLDSLEDVVAGVTWLEHSDPEVREPVERAVARLPHRRTLDLPIPEGLFPAFQFEIAEVHRDLFARNRDQYGDNVATKIERALEVSEADAAAARDACERYRVEFEAALDGLDLVIAPTLPIMPPPADRDDLEVREQMTLLTFPLNAVGAPALALPCGRSADGLPVSIQVFARPGEDALVLAVGRLLEDALGHTARPREEPEHPERGA
jgi:aspartyl-tRNA(Asn)/glutamyl-tRNA(Gln) amidotransferase subunit A